MILMGAGPKMNKYEPQHQVLISFFLYIVFHIFFHLKFCVNIDL